MTMTITEKVAYLKGLADGLELDKEPSKEGKLIAKIIDILEDVGLAVEDLEECEGDPKDLTFRQKVQWVCQAKDYCSCHLHYIFYHLLFFLLLDLAWETKG